MVHSGRHTTPDPLPRVWPIWLTSLLGAAFLTLLSFFQKWLIGADTANPLGYLVPVAFGGFTGFLLGFITRRHHRKFGEHLAQQRETLAELEHRERRFRLLAENASDVIFRWLLEERRYDYISPAVEDITGHAPDEFYANPDLLRDLIIPEDRQILEEMGRRLRAGKVDAMVEYRITHREGRLVWLNQRHNLTRDESGRAISLEGICRDTTHYRQVRAEKQDLEGKLLHSQKLEAVGQLAGGISHDFNNLLTVINGYSELLLSDTPEGQEPPFELVEIRRAGGMASELTQQLLAFSGKQVSSPRVLEPARAVNDSLRMLGRIVGEDIDIGSQYATELPSIYIESIQFDQILMNLLVNARDAMPRGGNIQIQMSSENLEAWECPTCRRQVSGSFLKLAVSDDGCGMTRDIREKVFVPFFSTKGSTRGKGLGLATVYGIIHGHQGHITVESEPNQGTTFTIYLPEYTDQGEDADDFRLPDPDLSRGNETILVVEDEPIVRRLSAKVLREYGYTVHVAENAERAREIFAEKGEAIDLLLTDVVMPGESGVDLALALLRLRNDLAVVFMSGYVDDKLALDEIKTLNRPFLRKPFGSESLAWAIRNTLDADRRDDSE